MSDFNYVDRTNEFSPEDIEENKVISAIAYLGPTFFLPLLIAPKSEFAKFHANQSFLIFLLAIVISIVRSLLRYVPFIGWTIRSLLNLLIAVLFILGLISAFQGEAKEIPIIGHIKIFNK